MFYKTFLFFPNQKHHCCPENKRFKLQKLIILKYCKQDQTGLHAVVSVKSVWQLNNSGIILKKPLCGLVHPPQAGSSRIQYMRSDIKVEVVTYRLTGGVSIHVRQLKPPDRPFKTQKSRAA